ncbi:MAG: biosynthetic-type acetolactate synthase large subunit [Pseudomonadota bacterium]|nr:biosynthetic-type acetolactate synthase large subunit [Pseudomonadota bacterium]
MKQKLGSDHPLSGARMTGADIIVQVLADEGVEVIFGYSGGAILPTYDAVFRYNDEHRTTESNSPMPLIVPANEQGAGFMAAGYARASGKVGVVMVTSGPGATNTATPVRDCLADSTPMVVICGQVPTTSIGTDAFQEAPVSASLGPLAKHLFLITDPSKIEATVRTAFEIARTGRPGPVVIDVPKDMQNWEEKFVGNGLLNFSGYQQRVNLVNKKILGDKECESFYELLKNSSRPLIYVGGGVINGNASNSLRALASHFGIPVTTTLMGIGSIDTTDNLALHMLGMHGTAYANYAVEDCDMVIAIGARFDDRVAGVPEKWAPNAKYIAQFDVDPSEIGKVKSVDWFHVGILDRDLKRILDYGKHANVKLDLSAWQDHIILLKKTYSLNFDRDSKRIQPNAIIEEINNHTKGNAVIATGVGQHQMWAAQYFDFCDPRLWLTSGSMGTMGFGLPAAIGAQFAKPNRLVIDVDGDASIRMNIGELETVTTYELPIKVVVLNNFGDGMVKQWQKLYYKGRLSASDKSLRRKDFIKTAEADGFKFAKRLEKASDVSKLIKEWLDFPGPAFLEVIIDPDAGVYPMVGPGLSYESMITGDFIPSREVGNPQEETDSNSMF